MHQPMAIYEPPPPAPPLRRPAIRYPFPLRPDMVVYATLPIDLTAAEAKRIEAFIMALAMPADERRESEGP